jgi:magnesium transporter
VQEPRSHTHRDWALTSSAPESADAAEVLPELEAEAALAYFLSLPPARRAETFAYLEFPQQQRLAAGLGAEVVAAVLADMCSDDRAGFLRRLPPEPRNQLVALLPAEDRAEALRLITYPDQSAGALMATEVVTVAPEATVERALGSLRQAAPRRELVQTALVTAENGRLLGRVDLLDLFTAPADRRVRDLMQPTPSIRMDADQEQAAQLIAKYDLLALPVVDEQGRLLGIITHDDALEVLQEEQSEDVQLASGIDPEPETSYREASSRMLVRKRIVWLLVLLVAALASSGVIAAFEQTLASVVALAFFIPVITGSGGNTGTQSATLIIRALAVGDVSSGDWARVFVKELLVGAALGACMAAAIYGIGLAWPAARPIAPVVAVTMVALVVWANLVGALLPMLLRRLGADPAVAGAPLVSTVVDASGLLIYFGVATLMLPD